MPYFCEDPESRAFEQLMRRVPNFEKDPPEAGAVQRSLERSRRQNTRKEGNSMIFRGTAHRKLFEAEMKLHPDATNRFTAVIYLLTADNLLWEQAKDFVSARDVDVQSMRPAKLSSWAYVCWCAAKDMVSGTRTLSIQDLADRSMLPSTTFLVLWTAFAIRGYGPGMAGKLRFQEGGAV